MYKLFLTFRYLTRKKIVIFPILVVWLCVMMLIIVTSIMGGFVDRVRDANRDLYGDIVISSGSSSRGFSDYDALSEALQAKFPEIRVITPEVEAYALLYVPEVSQSRPALLVGVKPEQRAQVSHFRESLYLQYRSPTAAVEDLSPRLPATRDELVAYAADAVKKATAEEGDAARAMIGLDKSKVSGRAYTLAEDRFHRADLAATRAQQTENYASSLTPGTYATPKSLTDAMLPTTPSFNVPGVIRAGHDNPDDKHDFVSPDGCIVGAQIGFFRRDTRGNFIHPVYPGYQKVIITVFPPSRKTGNISASMENAVQHQFTIVDDSHTGVYDVDSFNVYADFNLVQRLAGMAPDPELVKADPSANFQPLCHQLLIKLKEPWTTSGSSTSAEMKILRARIEDFVDSFQKDHPTMYPYYLDVQTWDEKQAKYLGAVENEKVMMTFILGLMSVVVLVVIFLIFYQIVRDKTRDIGIIKAVGGSEEGVAGIFLTYGLFIGLVGGGLGVLCGVLFVTHTNEIHEWIFQTTGVIIWDRSVYLFDRIPDKVYLRDILIYYGVALVAGLLGAFIPAAVAGRQDPVQAVRYE
jgi:lipoprotein-releasing system permease protein